MVSRFQFQTETERARLELGFPDSVLPPVSVAQGHLVVAHTCCRTPHHSKSTNAQVQESDPGECEGKFYTAPSSNAARLTVDGLSVISAETHLASNQEALHVNSGSNETVYKLVPREHILHYAANLNQVSADHGTVRAFTEYARQQKAVPKYGEEAQGIYLSGVRRAAGKGQAYPVGNPKHRPLVDSYAHREGADEEKAVHATNQAHAVMGKLMPIVHRQEPRITTTLREYQADRVQSTTELSVQPGEFLSSVDPRFPCGQLTAIVTTVGYKSRCHDDSPRDLAVDIPGQGKQGLGVLLNLGVGGRDALDSCEDCLWFAFPTIGHMVKLRRGDLLIFNTYKKHCTCQAAPAGGEATDGEAEPVELIPQLDGGHDGAAGSQGGSGASRRGVLAICGFVNKWAVHFVGKALARGR